jgi:hypothetical protein
LATVVPALVISFDPALPSYIVKRAMLRIVSLVVLGLAAAECEDCDDMQMLQKERRPSSFSSWKWAGLDAQPSPSKKVPATLAWLVALFPIISFLKHEMD